MTLKYALSILFILPLYAFAAITGTYNASGFNTDSSTYTAVVVITETDGIYSAVWTYPDSSIETGTGVRKDDSLAFVFLSGVDYGVQLYEIHHDHLSGPWVFYGDSVKGYETLTKVCHPIPTPPPAPTPT